MPPIWKPKELELLRNWCDTIVDESWDKLNEWERKFISSIDHQLRRSIQLSQHQENKLEQIYAEKTS